MDHGWHKTAGACVGPLRYHKQVSSLSLSSMKMGPPHSCEHSMGVHTHYHTHTHTQCHIYTYSVWGLPLESREVKQMAFAVSVAQITRRTHAGGRKWLCEFTSFSWMVFLWSIAALEPPTILWRPLSVLCATLRPEHKGLDPQYSILILFFTLSHQYLISWQRRCNV